MVGVSRDPRKREYGRRGGRPRLNQVSNVPLSGIRVEVSEIIKRVPVDPNTGKGTNQKIIGALRAAGFQVSKSVQGISVRRNKNEKPIFFRFKH